MSNDEVGDDCAVRRPRFDLLHDEAGAIKAFGDSFNRARRHIGGIGQQ